MLQLPVELRLDIYGYLTAFTLLQLTQTHPKFCEEINSIPKLYTSSPGYDPSFIIRANAFTFGPKYGTSTFFDIHHDNPLSKRDIQGLSDQQEYQLWMRIYQTAGSSLGFTKSKQMCCVSCLGMQASENFHIGIVGLDGVRYMEKWYRKCFACKAVEAYEGEVWYVYL
ncbi:hypothetical protein BJ508DRAFT_329323 [Ascobolus immersus RN42]|uniref:F-box domain-containing protein n=1 Tax=Ascobolus immersus RN42 TaxID=1160509 RepID=A0A3N4HWZ0_ASCIM|nr:hypothetical protein BJ508DRAFT_329323 [Ascobolus immersus RN42]